MRIFDTVYFVLWEMLPHYHFVLRWFSTDVPWPWHWLWHFAQIIVQGPWAKVARRYRTLFPLAGVGNTLTRRRTDFVSYIFRRLFCKQLPWTLHLVLYCGAQKEEKYYSIFFICIGYSSLVRFDYTIKTPTIPYLWA